MHILPPVFKYDEKYTYLAGKKSIKSFIYIFMKPVIEVPVVHIEPAQKSSCPRRSQQVDFMTRL
jgi:hypothetical protein